MSDMYIEPEYLVVENKEIMDIGQFLEEAKLMNGWFSGPEGELLMQFVGQTKDLDGSVVEIGSYTGKTTSYFAYALSNLDKNNLIYAIDPFTGSIEHEGFKESSDYGFSCGSTFNTFIRHLKHFGVYDYVIPIATTSDKAAIGWNNPIKILFIDGAHDNDWPTKDYQLFAKHIVKDGLLLFHDSDTPDVIRAIEVARQDGFKTVYAQGSLMAMKRE